MDKIVDTDEYVEYSFGRDGVTGIVRLSKANETISVVKECPLDASGKWSERAAMKLARLWRSGDLPEKTQWAS
jgi:acetyl-CoA carboxylase carboxyltransferase component